MAFLDYRHRTEEGGKVRKKTILGPVPKRRGQLWTFLLRVARYMKKLVCLTQRRPKLKHSNKPNLRILGLLKNLNATQRPNNLMAKRIYKLACHMATLTTIVLSSSCTFVCTKVLRDTLSKDKFLETPAQKGRPNQQHKLPTAAPMQKFCQ